MLQWKLHSTVDQVNGAMFPVWFMAYKNNNRVAYATVNGQTGKVVADLPVDVPKYLGASAILTIPIFLLLNRFFTVIPSVLLGIVAMIAAGQKSYFGVCMASPAAWILASALLIVMYYYVIHQNEKRFAKYADEE